VCASGTVSPGRSALGVTAPGRPRLSTTGEVPTKAVRQRGGYGGMSRSRSSAGVSTHNRPCVAGSKRQADPGERRVLE